MVNSREKGKRGEREVADLIRRFGLPARRGQQYRGGSDSPDVVGLPGVHVEVKLTERFQPYEALDQAEADTQRLWNTQEDPDQLIDTPVVFHRRNRKRWIVVLDALDFLELYGETGRAVLEAAEPPQSDVREDR